VCVIIAEIVIIILVKINEMMRRVFLVIILQIYLKSSVELTPQFTLQKFKVVNPAWIQNFLVKRASSHDNENNITILVNLLERVSQLNF
jgi:hypothetical protein